jgi:hypothetical protein
MIIVDFIKIAYNYCSFNKAFLILILSLMAISNYLSKVFITDGNLLTAFSMRAIFLFIFWGYGLQITEDVVLGGERLPKILPRKILRFGVKGVTAYLFYIMIQIVLLSIISVNFGFPIVGASDLLLDLNGIASLYYAHNPKDFIIFIILDFIITYITVFFMEIGLARITDNENLRDAFNFKQIWETIKIIGIKKYSIEYTYIILSIVIITFFKNFFDLLPYLNFVTDLFLELLLFVIEFMSIGLIYRKSKIIILEDMKSRNILKK